MEIKKLTAIEYLEKTINHMLYNGGDLGEDAPALMIHINRAKLMEKEQIIEFADEYADAVMGGCIKRAEQYYNETYGKQ